MARSTICLLLSLVFAACGGGAGTTLVGGGGGGGEPPIPPAQGIRFVGSTYLAVGVGSRAPDDFASFAGAADVPTATELALDLMRNDGSSVVSDASTAIYDIAEDLSMAVGGPAAQPAGAGGVAGNADYAAFAADAPAQGAQMHVLARRRALGSPNEVQAVWHVAWLGLDGTAPIGMSARAFLGAGVVELNDLVINVDGSVVTTPFGTVDYEITPAGAFVIDPAGKPIVGGLSADGNVLVAGGDTIGDAPMIQLYVRATPGASSDLLTGTYWVTWISRQGGRWVSHTGTTVLDGDGSGRIVARSTDGLTSSDETVDFRYVVDTNGALSIGTLGGDSMSLVGGVTGDGRFAMAGGSTDAEPALMTFIRK